MKVILSSRRTFNDDNQASYDVAYTDDRNFYVDDVLVDKATGEVEVVETFLFESAEQAINYSSNHRS